MSHDPVDRPGPSTADRGPAGADAPPAASPPPAASGPPAVPSRERRPLVERVGMAAIALVLATLFAGVGAAAFVSGEPFLGIMAALGALMTAWVGAVTLFRG